MNVLVLDTGPLGILCNSSTRQKTIECTRMLQSFQRAGWLVVVPEVCDYEVRRELLLQRMFESIVRLDNLIFDLTYLPITTKAMRLAAELWAESRRIGKPLADRHALDGDVILAAQVKLLNADQAIVATSNVGHLNQFVDAREWQEIEP